MTAFDLLEDPEGAPYPEEVQVLARLVEGDVDARVLRERIVAACESIADHWRAELRPSWEEEVSRARPTDEGPGVHALACLLRDDESTPPALRAIAAAFTRTRIGDRPRARSSDPETSVVAGENVVVQRRRGSSFHRLLRTYADLVDAEHPRMNQRGNLVRAMTSREVEVLTGIREAHKRTSDLLTDGLLEVVLDDDGRDVVRDGGRVLTITRAGREELVRLDAPRSLSSAARGA